MQSYHIPLRLASLLAKKEQRAEKNALRLWFFCKTVPSMEASFYLKDQKHLLQNYFHPRQIKKYLDILIKKGWMGKDSHGKYYLRGRKFMFKVVGLKSKMLTAVVEHENTLSMRQWDGFLSATTVVTIQRSMARNTDQVRIDLAATYKSCEDSAGSTPGPRPVSCENIVLTTGVSRATASRMRQRAHKAGLIINRLAFEKTRYEANSRMSLLELRGELAETLPAYRRQVAQYCDPVLSEEATGRRTPTDRPVNPNALMMSYKYRGRVVQQRPNMVQNVGITFKKVSR